MLETLPTALNKSGRIVLYTYTDIPGDYHAVYLETNAFGWGRSEQVALEGLRKTLEGHYEEARAGNPNLVIPNPDPESVELYNKGKHPAIETVQPYFRGTLEFSVTVREGKTEVGNMQLKPSLEQRATLDKDPPKK